jgi:peptide-methionine (S)-S-oxide reductase
MRIFLPMLLILTTLPLMSAKGMDVATTLQDTLPQNTPYASFAGGCFWCLESEFRRIEGVVYTRSGYEGGSLENPTYEDITTGKTGHAETTEIYYDPSKVTYRQLLDHFLRLAHDPTTLNAQGVDVGTQYRSAIFYHDTDQKNQAEEAIEAAEADKVWKDAKIVTSLEPHGKFWPAEEYHQQYYEKYEKKTGSPHIRALYKMQKWAKQKLEN